MNIIFHTLYLILKAFCAQFISFNKSLASRSTFIASRSTFIASRSTFIASRYKYISNIECIKGEEFEKVFSGSRIRHSSFLDFIIFFRAFHHLQASPLSLEHRGSRDWYLSPCKCLRKRSRRSSGDDWSLFTTSCLWISDQPRPDQP